MQTAADIARAFAEVKDTSRAAALDRLLRLGATAANADALGLYWRVRERTVAVSRDDSVEARYALQQQLRRRIWPWMLRQRPDDHQRLLYAPAAGGTECGAPPPVLLPLRDPRGALAGVLVLSLTETARAHVMGPWRQEAIEFSDLVQAWLQAELDPQTALLSVDSFNEEIRHWQGLPEKRHRTAAILGLQLDYLAEVKRVCGDEATVPALLEVLELIETRLRQRDLVGRTGLHSLGVFLRQCSDRDAFRVAAEIEATLVGYRFRWEQHSFAPHLRINVRALPAPDRRQWHRRCRAGELPMAEQRRRGGSTPAASRSGSAVADSRGRSAPLPASARADGEPASSASAKVIVLGAMDTVQSTGGRSGSRAGQADEDSHRSTRHRQPVTPGAEKAWRLQPCIELDGSGSVVAYRLRSLGADRAVLAADAPVPRASVQRQLTVLFDQLRDGVIAGRTLPVILLDMPAVVLVDPTVEWLLEACRLRGLSPESFCLSVPEEALVSQLRRRLSVLQCLRRLGFPLCVETSATGSASPVLLERLSPQFVRPAAQLVHEVGRDSAAARLLAEEIRMTHAIGARVLCGGIDTPAILSRCSAAAVDVGHGRACGASLSLALLTGTKRP